MTKCSKCNFIVQDTMRFALMQNSCPSCGGHLFSSEDSSIIGVIQNKLIGQSFTKTLDDSGLYDLTLFIFNELRHGIGRQMVERALKNSGDKMAAPLNSEDDIVEFDEREALRKEVEAELDDDLKVLSNSGDSISEDMEAKKERLKRLYEQRKAEDSFAKAVGPNGKLIKKSKPITRIG